MRTRAFEELAEGDVESWRHTITADEVDSFAELSGDFNRLHMDDEFARRHGFRGRVVHGMLAGAFLSRVLGTMLPGPGVLWLSQTIRFAPFSSRTETIRVNGRVHSSSRSDSVQGSSVHNVTV